MKASHKTQIDEIFTYWQKVMDHPTAKLISSRSRAIAARLNEGYTVDEIKLAIDGCRSSSFHMGDNLHRTVYDDLTLICRDGAKLEQFIGRRRSISRTSQPGRPSEPLIPTCSACRGTGYIDSHPDTPGFVPGRHFLPCSACSPPDS